ncbi:M20/M25/M40 family metallo-hydrolase [uncultured Martelella sp.]|uniref:M20/M25/M40 family metallo-hydrolase n=1 Tax=uncultured Martelella sp. TaxID=392331 RepID=UPI0029C8030D|nr:M20/M25/M40 family metallo-hydrolase [uncultured Martelella sp.]
MTEIETILASQQFKAAAAVLKADHDRFVEDIITLTEIPSPPFGEEKRALAYEAMFNALGLEDVGRDGIGNVTGLRRGRGNGGLTVVAAHLDTVFPEGTDCTVRREGTKLFAPGVGDDTRGLAVLLAFIRALDAANIETESDLLFVGDVGEEGKGDLRGVRHLFTENAYRDRITAFFTMDGISLDRLVTGAVGSRRYHISFTGPGGHSLAAFGTVNPAHALAHVVTGLSRTEVPENPRTTYCASVLGGGTSINAIPNAVWLEVDLRSEDAGALEDLDATLHRLIAEAVAAENERGDTETGVIAAKAELIGNRPAGRTDEDSRIVTATTAALQAFGFKAEPEFSSTDANIAMSLGIPAVCVGTGGDGGRAHSLEEWIDVEPENSVRGLTAGLAAILGTAGLWNS